MSLTNKLTTGAKNLGTRFGIVSVALIALAVVFNVARDGSLTADVPVRIHIIIKWSLVAVWSLIGVIIVRHSKNVLIGMLGTPKTTDVRASSAVIRAFSTVGYVLVAVESLNLLQVKVTSILVGGALTGVIVGIAAQSTLSNIFAGILLFTLRPFRVGQTVIVRSSTFGGIEYMGTVVDNNWFYTILVNSEGQAITIPNSSVVIAAVTVLADERVQTYTVPMPYSVSMTDLEDRFMSVVGNEVSIKVKDFGENSYTVQIGLPMDAHRDALRAVIAKLKSEQSQVTG